MRVSAALAGMVVASLCYAQPPAIGQNGIVNAASQIPTRLPGSAIARGARFFIQGVRFGTRARVRLLRNGTLHEAVVRSVQPERIEAAMPIDAPLGAVSLTVETAAGGSRPFEISVAASRPGLYSANQKGWGPGKIDVIDDHGHAAPNTLSAPARKGQVASVLATGLGNAGNIEILVGGRPASDVAVDRDVEPEIDRVRFRIPAEAPDGCYVPVYARVRNSVRSNVVTIAIAASGSRCTMPGGVAPIQSQRLGIAGISRTALLFDSGQPLTVVDEAYGVFLAPSRPEQQSSPLLTVPPEGTCTAYTGTYDSGIPDASSFPNALLGLLEGRGMDAGAALVVQDAGSRRTIPARGDGAYWARLALQDPGLRTQHPLFFENHEYSVSAAGGRDVGGFSEKLFPVPEFLWRNEQTLATIPRDRGVPVEWSGVIPGDSVLLFAIDTDPISTATALSLCTARREAGRMVIPPDILSYFPRTRKISGRPSSLLFVISFRLHTALEIKGLDQLWTLSSFTLGRRVSFQ